jgi:3-dehydroquinate synthase
MTTLPLKNYSIFIGESPSGMAETISRGNYSKVAVLVDENTRQVCLPLFQEKIETALEVIEIASGESQKNIGTCTQIWGEMMHLGLDRHSLLVNLGGGVIGDMGGFCAATYLRGIDFMQVPTTLLSQVDASVGGKLGIDFKNVKNSVGVFRDPQAVWVNPVFLNTLPDGEIRSGFAEIFKHALIADKALWNDLRGTENLREVDWEPLLTRSLGIKKQVVEEDPFEKGIRKALNFGHTIGHAVESLALQKKQPLLHGEAVAIGMVCESFLSQKNTGLSDGELSEIVEVIERHYPHFSFSENDFPELLRLMRKDKKNRAGKINFSMLPTIGRVQVNQVCEAKEIEAALRFYIEKN